MYTSIKYTLTKCFLIGIFLAKKRRHKAESSQNPTNKTCHRRRYFFLTFPSAHQSGWPPKKWSFFVNIYTHKKINQKHKSPSEDLFFFIFLSWGHHLGQTKKKSNPVTFFFSPCHCLSFTLVVTRNHIYLCVYIYIHIYIYIYIHMYTCTYVFIYVYMYTYVYVCIYVYVYICIYIYTYMHVFLYILMHTHT